jgi:hypothetical protein
LACTVEGKPGGIPGIEHRGNPAGGRVGSGV